MNEKNFSSEHRPVRSDSEMRVDLHIYIIPQELWREHLQSAVNQVINETVSAGFIRVFPDATVSSLREEIENQIGFEIIPREFVFLKCVGRCFTRIKSRQENLLKVKNFIPPQAYAPEMFILEATADIRALPDSGSVSAQSQTSFQNGYHSDSGSFSSHSRVPPIKSHAVAVQTDRGSKVFSNSEDVEDCGDGRQQSSLAESLSEQNHYSKSTQTTHLTGQESPEIKKYNPKKSKNRFPRSSSPEDEGYDPPLNAIPNHSPKLSLKVQQQQQQQQQQLAKGIQTLSEKEMRELEEQLSFRRQIGTEKRKAEETEKAEKDRPRRKKEEEQRRKEEEHKRSEEEKWRKEAGGKKKQDDEEKKRKAEELRKEEERIREEEREKEEEKRKDEQRKREEEETRQEEQRKSEEEKLQEKKRQLAAEKATFLKEIEELKVARQELEERQDFLMRKTKLLQTKTPVNKHNVRDNWKKKYFEEKKKTAPLDEHGNRLKQHLQTLHKKLMASFESFPPPPPPPPPLPASSARTEAKVKKANSSSSSSSLHVKAKQLEHDIEEIQQQLEGVKMKLTGEIKLRNQAEKDIRVLQAELSQRKLQNNLQDQTPRTQYVTMPKS